MRRIVWMAVVMCGGVSLASRPEAHAAEPTEKQFSNSLAMKFVRLEPGEFLMGQGGAPPRTREDWIARDGDETPAHKVTITKPF
jgi:formylglycine-generating enzyme